MKVLAAVLVASLIQPVMADVTFKKVQLRATFQGVKQGSNGRLVIGQDGIRFMGKKGATFQLPAEATKTTCSIRESRGAESRRH